MLVTFQNTVCTLSEVYSNAKAIAFITEHIDVSAGFISTDLSGLSLDAIVGGRNRLPTYEVISLIIFDLRIDRR